MTIWSLDSNAAMAGMGIYSLGLNLEELLILLHQLGILVSTLSDTSLRMSVQLSSAAKERTKIKLAIYITRKDHQTGENPVSHLVQVSVYSIYWVEES